MIQIARNMGNSKSISAKADRMLYCIEKNNIAEVRNLLLTTPELLERPLSKDTQHTPLMRATYKGNMEIVQLILEQKPALNTQNHKKETALVLAIKRGFLDIVKILISEGANCNIVSTADLTPIDYAILPGFYDIASLLLKQLEEPSFKSV